MIVRAIIMALLVFGCSKSRRPEGAAPAASAPPSASSPAIAPAMKGSTEIVNVVRAWNDATNAHDAKKLGALYADEVELYGQRVSRERAMSIKGAAFATHDRDDLGEVTVLESRALFTKKSRGKNGKVIEVTGYIDLDPAMKITAEGDTTTDTNLERKKYDDCAAAIGALVDSTHLGGADVRQIVKEPDGRWGVQFTMVHFGDPNGNYSYLSIHVDPSSGAVIGATDEVIPADPSLAAKVRSQCK